MADHALPGGGQWLLETACSREFAVPEEMGEEAEMMAKTAEDFILGEVMPRVDEIEACDTKIDTTIQLMKQAGELGLLGIEVPEEYGGFGQDMKTTMYVSERLTGLASFSASILAHNGLGSLPLVYFGTKEQKEKYLSKLATGEMLAAYALTEEDYGSDALNAKTRAVLSEDGTFYTLDGSKMYITNAGFADLFTVYAQVVDGNEKKFTAFLVEKDHEGFSTGPEEDKMGIRGSSTRRLILEGCKVPAENVLGDIGRGHKSALNVLNVGRFKLGVASIGGCKGLIALSAKYANERSQFGKPISSFGMIRRKLADMATGTYAGESMGFALAGLIDSGIGMLEHDDENWQKNATKWLEEYALEAGLLKVYGSEILDMCVDECMQIHGGYGYSEEYPVARPYRDSRINRIFEGTNEINRLLAPGTIIKKAMKGELDLIAGAVPQLTEAIEKGQIDKKPAEGPLGRELTVTTLSKKMIIYSLGIALMKFMMGLIDKQIILEKHADMIMTSFAMETALGRARKLVQMKGEEGAQAALDMAQLVVYEGANMIASLARTCAADVSEGSEEEFAKYEAAIDALRISYPVDTNTLKDRIASRIIEAEKYVV